jgi:hypothetical protein
LCTREIKDSKIRESERSEKKIEITAAVQKLTRQRINKSFENCGLRNRGNFCDSGGDGSGRGFVLSAYMCFGGIYCLYLQGSFIVGYSAMVSTANEAEYVINCFTKPKSV